MIFFISYNLSEFLINFLSLRQITISFKKKFHFYVLSINNLYSLNFFLNIKNNHNHLKMFEIFFN